MQQADLHGAAEVHMFKQGTTGKVDQRCQSRSRTRDAAGGRWKHLDQLVDELLKYSNVELQKKWLQKPHDELDHTVGAPSISYITGRALAMRKNTTGSHHELDHSLLHQKE